MLAVVDTLVHVMLSDVWKLAGFHSTTRAQEARTLKLSHVLGVVPKFISEGIYPMFSVRTSRISRVEATWRATSVEDIAARWVCVVGLHVSELFGLAVSKAC